MASVILGSTSLVPAFRNLQAQQPPRGPEPRLSHQSLLSAVKTEQRPQESWLSPGSAGGCSAGTPVRG